MLRFALISSLLTIVLFIASTWGHERIIQFFPTLSFFFLVIIPQIYLNPFFVEPSATIQLWSACSFFLFVGIGDFMGYRIVGRLYVSDHQRDLLVEHALFVALVLALIAIPILHVVAAGDVPLIHVLENDRSILGNLRERFSKLLDVPYFVKVIFVWHTSILSPILFCLLVIKRQYYFAGALFVWAMLYAALSLARLPAIVFVFISAFVILNFPPSAVWRTWAMRGSVWVLTIFVIAGIYRGEILWRWYQNLGQAQLEHSVGKIVDSIPMTPADVERLDIAGANPPTTFGYLGDYAIYRAFLSPTEVANRWYAFFPEHSGGWRSLADLTTINRGADWRHASNLVAVWAYTDRFPTRYLPSAHAYASADADAYAFGGIWMVIIFGILFMLTRVAIALAVVARDVSVVLYLACLALLAALPFQASFQALVLSHGLCVLVGFLFWLKAADLITTHRCRIYLDKSLPRNDIGNH